ncbi:MAG: hypothetical protein Q9220_003092 [cf. Caloplaca sp. 1 TL-2023]
MSMSEVHKQRSNGEDSPQKPVLHPPPPTPRSSPLLPNPQQRKHWAKQYRTEIAASSSSLLSTIAAVSRDHPVLQSIAMAANKSQYPLDSIKTRMQATHVYLAQIYPIDSAKTHYQRNCLTKARGQPVKMPRIQFNKASMYRGLGVSMARSCMINTIFFSSFEMMKKRINNLPDPVG